MAETRFNKNCLFNNATPISNHENIKKELEDHLNRRRKIIIVLDDDPTGIQTVHGINVYMTWSKDILLQAFKNESLFYIQTNSRAMNKNRAEEVNKEIMENILYASESTGKDFSIISRSDSTLRGHYPLETRVLKKVFEQNTGMKIDGEILAPFFAEGGRYTYNDIHYVQEGEYLVMAGMTEFAKDSVFGYKNSDLKLYIEEKHQGICLSQDVSSITLELIRSNNIEAIEEILLNTTSFRKIIVNALAYEDLDTFVLGLLRAEEKGKRFLFRTAASFVKVYGGIQTKEFLGSDDFGPILKNNRPGIVIVGSYVQRTTKQLEQLLQFPDVMPVEVDVNVLLVDEQKRIKVIKDAIQSIETAMKEKKLAVVYTSRQLVKSSQDTGESNLEISVRISESLVQMVKGIKYTPSFVVVKGGITSSDIAVKGMEIVKAKVLGQILPGIPVIISETEGKWPGTPYVIFPGNVGDEFSLREVVEILSKAVD